MIKMSRLHIIYTNISDNYYVKDIGYKFRCRDFGDRDFSTEYPNAKIINAKITIENSQLFSEEDITNLIVAKINNITNDIQFIYAYDFNENINFEMSIKIYKICCKIIY